MSGPRQRLCILEPRITFRGLLNSCCPGSLESTDSMRSGEPQTGARLGLREQEMDDHVLTRANERNGGAQSKVRSLNCNDNQSDPSCPEVPWRNLGMRTLEFPPGLPGFLSGRVRRTEAQISATSASSDPTRPSRGKKGQTYVPCSRLDQATDAQCVCAGSTQFEMDAGFGA